MNYNKNNKKMDRKIELISAETRCHFRVSLLSHSCKDQPPSKER